MTVHYVKSWKHLYAAAITGEKTHDMRRSGDRDYKVGDILILREYDQNKYLHTGREAAFQITYITSVENPCALSGNGLKSEYCILSIKLIGELKDKAAELPIETQVNFPMPNVLGPAPIKYDNVPNMGDLDKYEQNKIKCPNCDGSGECLEGVGLVPCTRCVGTGYLYELKWIDNVARTASPPASFTGFKIITK